MKKNSTIKKLIITAVTVIALMICPTVTVFAEEAATEPVQTDTVSEYGAEADELNGENVFEDIYNLLSENADKIFSILAFIGTLIVSVGYKSGLIPLLNDALSKLRNSIESVKENEAIRGQSIDEKIDKIGKAMDEMDCGVRAIEARVGEYGEVAKERATLKLILQNQIDMLYAIFQSSALPQYQKEEIGVKIQRMREELASYGEELE